MIYVCVNVCVCVYVCIYIYIHLPYIYIYIYGRYGREKYEEIFAELNTLLYVSCYWPYTRRLQPVAREQHVARDAMLLYMQRH